MNKLLKTANDTFLEPTGITELLIQDTLNGIMRYDVDSADLYFQTQWHESWMIEKSIVKSGSYTIEQGVGVRAISGEKTGFAYSDDINAAALTQAAGAARSISKQGQEKHIQAWHKSGARELYKPDSPIDSMTDIEKIAILQHIDKYARDKDARVQEVIASLAATHEVILVADTDGTFAADVRPLVRVNVTVIIEENGKREQASSGGGGRFTFMKLAEGKNYLSFVDEAVRQALLKLDAIAAPAGTMPVVLGPGWPGVLLHEAVGHGLEGDFNRKGSSAFSGRIGEQVASPLCTIVDNGTLAGRRGSLNIDDEGTPTQNTVLIEKGILKTYMQDKMNARLMGRVPTGNARRESYTHTPMPRMTNTYMLAGNHHPDEIIKSVKKGIYAVNFDGGQVDITSGKFVFSANEAYLIEDGKVTAPIKGATLIGDGPAAMQKVSMVGDDLMLDSGVGVCGKEGQSVPVGVGQPTLKIDEIIVGGTSN